MMYVLIVLIFGWGAGVGSQGNAVTMQEFTTKANCEAAAERINKGMPDKRNGGAICMEK